MILWFCNQVGLLSPATKVDNYQFLISLLLVVLLCQVLLWGRYPVSLGQSGVFSCFNKFYHPFVFPVHFSKKKKPLKNRSLTSKVLPCWADCVLRLQWLLRAEAQGNTAPNPHTLSLQAVTKLWKRELGLFNLEKSPGRPSCSLSVLKWGL